MQFDIVQARQELTNRFPIVNGHPDVAGLIRDPQMLALLGPALVEPFTDGEIDLVLAPASRGPIFGALAAQSLGTGLVFARKEGDNHPGADIPIHSRPTWRGDPVTFMGRSFDFIPDQRVLIVDDWLTTGNSVRAMQAMLRLLGATCVGTAVVVNKADPDTLAELEPHWLVAFDDLIPPPPNQN